VLQDMDPSSLTGTGATLLAALDAAIAFGKHEGRAGVSARPRVASQLRLCACSNSPAHAANSWLPVLAAPSAKPPACWSALARGFACTRAP
jgi:hypothetical protein